MEILNTIQSIVPFGSITISILTLLGVALLAALVLWVGQQALKLMLNTGHEKAPEYKFLEGNVVLEKLNGFIKPENLLTKYGDGWAIRSFFDGDGWNYYDRYNTNNSTSCTKNHIKSYSVHRNKRDAISHAELLLENGKGYFPVIIKTLQSFLTLDLIIWLLPQHFTLTMTVLLSAGFIWTIRTLAGKLYENTSKTNINEEKITDLETKIK